VELKARYPDHGKAMGILSDLGSREGGTEEQVDTYFDVGSGRLKLREIAGSEAELIFYRRNESGGRRDCTYDIFRHPDPSALKTVLTAALGVQSRVRKTRHVHWLEGVKVNLDDVEGLGRFIEFEAAADARGPERAQCVVRDMVSRFGIRPEDVISSSYSDMLGHG
jgi:predicted adenylyl cyclase CyaB